MVRALGGEVSRSGVREYGKADVRVTGLSALFKDLPLEQTVWMSHSDAVVRPPDGFRVVAETDAAPAAALEDPSRGLYGVQFHPEVAHTPNGLDLLKNFLYEI